MMSLRYCYAHSASKLLLTGFVLFLVCAAFEASAETRNQERASKENLDKVKASIKKVQDKLQSDRHSKEATLNELKEIEKQIAVNAKSLYQLQQEIITQDKKLTDLVSQQATLEQQRTIQQLLIEKQILSAYQKGGQNKLKMVLNQENPDELARLLTYYDLFSQARAKQISEYIKTLESLQVVALDIKSRQADLTAKQQLQEVQQSALQQGRQQRQDTLRKLDSSIHSRNKKLASLKADQKKLEELLASMRDSIQGIKAPKDYRPFAQLRGAMPWPAQGKKQYLFGRIRPHSKLPWQGMAIQANTGTPVSAIHHGRVVFADWLRGSGLLIIIDHGDGYISLYAHNQTLLREVGDWVSTADTIATIGDSGGQQQAGLYFEIRHNGAPIDPAKWCIRST